MSHSLYIMRLVLFLVVAVPFIIWLAIRSLKKTDDPAELVFKWIITVPIFCYLLFSAFPDVAQGGMSAIGGLMKAILCGLALAIVWRRSIAMIIAKPFGSLYDGGDQEIEARPFYSAALAHRKRGRYQEAIHEVRAQLAKFPHDFDGQLLLAEIQAEHMNDLPGAELTIQRLCNQPGHAPKSLAFALSSMADWHLKYGQDREAAQQHFEKIMALFPESEMSALAAQRIAHLATLEQMLSPHDRRKITVTPGVEDIGLLQGAQQPKAPEIDYDKQAADYVKHLELHPLDTEAREKLAVIYADHFERLDMAAEQLEQLITHPNQPAKRVAHWLNLLADLQLKHGANYDAIRATLQRIMEMFPHTALAELASSRIVYLRLELKGKEKSQAVKLGSYEDDVGLKGGSPHQL